MPSSTDNTRQLNTRPHQHQTPISLTRRGRRSAAGRASSPPSRARPVACGTRTTPMRRSRDHQLQAERVLQVHAVPHPMRCRPGGEVLGEQQNRHRRQPTPRSARPGLRERAAGQPGRTAVIDSTQRRAQAAGFRGTDVLSMPLITDVLRLPCAHPPTRNHVYSRMDGRSLTDSRALSASRSAASSRFRPSVAQPGPLFEIRALVEQAVATLKSWRLLQNLRCSIPAQTDDGKTSLTVGIADRVRAEGALTGGSSDAASPLTLRSSVEAP